jgi:hypothetical protein
MTRDHAGGCLVCRETDLSPAVALFDWLVT